MSILNRWLEYLYRNGVRYSHSVHAPGQTAPGTADAERIPPHELAKPVVYRGDTGFGIAVVAADKRVDLLEVARLRGISYIDLADEGQMAERFPDCELGAEPPFGEAGEMPVVLDSGIAAREFIAFPIGTYRDIVRMSVADYRRLAKPLIGSITVNHTTPA